MTENQSFKSSKNTKYVFFLAVFVSHPTALSAFGAKARG